MKESVQYVQNIEKAIKEKYGEDAVQDPRSGWDDKKEKNYLKQKKDNQNNKKTHKKEKIDADGFLVSRKLLNRKDTRTCPICDKYSFQIKDDVYIKKFECCAECFIQHVEGREDKWEEKKRKLINDES